jgi:hypothetical protein
MPVWITELFVNPGYLASGAALLSVPVIIHLINRLRFRRVKWAAMEFLLASQQRNRRRVLLEQLLLLLLRIMLVALLVMLVARPLLDPRQWAFLRGEKTQHLVLVDDSGSMQDRWAETTAFDAARDVVRKLAAEGERRPDTQTLTLLLLSNPDQPLFTRETINADFVARLESALKTMQCSHRALDLAQGVEAAHRMLLDQPGAARSFHLVSDYRRADWADDAAVVGALTSIEASGAAVNLVKTVPEWHANLGITDISGALDVAAASVPLRLSVTVRNYGEQAARDIRLNILADGKRLPVAEAIDYLEPGKDIVRQFDVRFERTGPHDVRVSLPADALEQDNHRYLSVNLPDANAILIVDGSPSNSEAFYLADALAPEPGLTGFAPSIEAAEYLRRHPLDRFQSLFLLNVAELPPDSVRAVEQFVAGGGGLCWYLGDQVRGAFYNDKLYADGAGLFPCRLGVASTLVIDDAEPIADVAFAEHPLFGGFRGEDRTTDFARRLHVDRYFAVAQGWTPPEGVERIAELRNKAPLFFEHRFGKGVVITCLTSVGFSWTNWPQEPGAYVPLQLEIARHIARRRQALEQKVVGEPLAMALDASAYAPQAEIGRPDGSRVPMTLGISMTKGAEAAPPEENGAGAQPRSAQAPAYELAWRQTDDPGLYTVSLRRQDGSDELRRFSYNVPDSESRLELVTTEVLRRKLGAESKIQVQEPGQFDWIRGEQTQSDLHDYVLAMLLLVLAAEQAMALRLSYHPRMAGGRA